MIPFIAALPAIGRSVVPSVVGAVMRGATQAEAIRLIRSAGQPFSMLGPWGRVLKAAMEAKTYSQNIRSVNRNRAPNVARLPVSMGDQRRQFSWTVRIDLLDDQGEQFEQFLTVSTDNPRMTIGEIQKAALDALEQGSGDPSLEPMKAVVVGGTQRYSGV